MSIERVDLQWQSDVLAAHYRLANTPRLVPGTSEVTNEAWADAHAEFHRTLIRACAVPTLIATCSSLSDATVLYQQWSAAPKSSRGRDGEAEHQAIVDAVLAGDADTAVARLCAHYEATKRMVTGFDSRLRATSGEPDGHRPRAAGVTGARRSGADAPR
jgi:DNA-binding GntR family transcriptional regulator